MHMLGLVPWPLLIRNATEQAGQQLWPVCIGMKAHSSFVGEQVGSP